MSTRQRRATRRRGFLARYRKTVAAALGATATWGIAASADGVYAEAEWWGLLAALVTAVGVYQVRNVNPTDTAPDPTVSEAEV